MLQRQGREDACKEMSAGSGQGDRLAGQLAFVGEVVGIECIRCARRVHWTSFEPYSADLNEPELHSKDTRNSYRGQENGEVTSFALLSRLLGVPSERVGELVSPATKTSQYLACLAGEKRDGLPLSSRSRQASRGRRQGQNGQEALASYDRVVN
ncbi:hypothetical protein CPB86DRAFT_802136 [Serendipita vermifera]|nr:hypothetical protein CPB86DRAFT_802136 [Serendipita vermifera]